MATNRLASISKTLGDGSILSPTRVQNITSGLLKIRELSATSAVQNGTKSTLLPKKGPRIAW
jgi:hypothetical protein